ncbi:hypothetical protein MKW92_001414 [Papaver armeniacum]|nr:hypothetical protein MKW92_001414 [Papaver armeniacum]
MEDSEREVVVNELFEIVREISGFPECKNTSKKLYSNLLRRVKLLSPLFEELKDIEILIDEDEIRGLGCLKVGLEAAKNLLRSVNEGSKLFQALQKDNIVKHFHDVTEQIEQALSEISYDKLNISRKFTSRYIHNHTEFLNRKIILLLIELVHAQFRRAKERSDSPDVQLYMDLYSAQNERDPDPAILKRLSEKLQLKTINDLKKESLALHEMVISSGGDPGDWLEEMSVLLKKLKDSVLAENTGAETSDNEKVFMRSRSPVIPDDFRCPISLELMKDPVIVSTGQTYERTCIQKWLDAGHKTCPKTQQTLSHTALTPNYVLKSLIAQWCESNGIELPKNQGSCKNKNSSNSVPDRDRAGIEALLQKLSHGNPEEQRAAAGEFRVCIMDAGVIPLLVELLSSPDNRTQEHAVTALLNLSINETNKGNIVNAGAIPDIVEVLKSGSMEAREKCSSNPFQEASRKKDAATAIFNLSIYQGNKVRAVRAGIVVPLMRLLKDAGGGMVDEALAIMAILASHHEGKTAIGLAEPIPSLIDVMRTGSPRNRENAAAVLWSLCTGDVQRLKTLKELGAEEALKELSENGTDRAKEKRESS